MNKICILVVCALIGTVTLQAQSWQWAKRMGGASNHRWGHQLAASATGEDVLDMATDPNGNVYLLYTDRDTLMNVDGRTVSGRGKNDLLLASFSCTGAYRWSKVIGTSLDSDKAIAVRADELGGVYVCGELHWLSNSPGHVGTDTTINSAGRGVFLAKWDTSGNYKWLRMPQPDTMSRMTAYTFNSFMDMDVDAQGNSYLLAYLSPGAYAGGNYIVAKHGWFVLMYEIGGHFVRGTRLAIQPSTIVQVSRLDNVLTHLTCNLSRERFIIKGYNLGEIDSIGSLLLPYGAYIATFNVSNGDLGFVKTSNGYGTIIPGRVKVDAQDNLYTGGITRDYSTFNGVSFSNLPAFPANRGGAFIMKMDAYTGNPVWTNVARTSVYGDARGSAIAVTGNKVLFGGSFRDSVIFPTDSFNNDYLKNGDDCFAIQLNAATGTIQQIRTFGGPGNSNVLTSMDILYGIEADKRGNFYLCGIFDNKAFAVGKDTLQTIGGSDAFVTKWGYANCNCLVPKASYTASTPAANTIRYRYTGTTAGMDSLVWEWGDGTRTKHTSGFNTIIPHTFPTAGYYKVCVTAYTANCGQHTYCQEFPLSVAGIVALSAVKVYPNPASDRLTIDGLKDGRAVLYTMLGQQVMSRVVGSDQEVLHIGDLPAGVYVLMLSDIRGEHGVVRITKR